ncbi:glycosyltransferase [Leptolyngbya sp. 15MV]|nr:glycosyltransferase [Leptolyngbya sp. 15MV]
MLYRLIAATPQVRHVVLSLSGPGVLSARLADAGAILVDHNGGHTMLGRLLKGISTDRPDIIQGWMYHGNLAAMAVKARYPAAQLFWNIRQSIAIRNLTKPSTRALIRLQAQLSRFPRAIIYNSGEGAESHERLGFAAERRTLIPNGFDTDEFRPDSSLRATMRNGFGIGTAEVAIGLIARFDPWKNHAGFFRMAERMLDTHTHCRFILAGHGMEWSNSELAALVPSDRLRERMILLGDRRDIPAIYAALDIACNVSHGEGFPNAVGEAMACGLPCVVTPVGATAELVGDFGIVARSTDDAALFEAFFRAVGMTREGREAMGRAARERIIAEFSIDSVARRYLDLYSKSLTGKRLHRGQG